MATAANRACNRDRTCKAREVSQQSGDAGFWHHPGVGRRVRRGHLLSDISGVRTASTFAYLLLGIALLTALGFEFVNGFHDTANAVATVIYTHSMEPHVAVSGRDFSTSWEWCSRPAW